MEPKVGAGTTSALVHDLRGPASHVTVDVVDPRGTRTPVSQALHQIAAKRIPQGPPPPTLLVTGIVVAATVISAGMETWSPTFVALGLAGLVVLAGRLVERRARRTDRSTTWASRPGQAFGAWAPGAPLGRTRLVIDQRGLGVTDLTTARRPLAVLLWRSVTRLTIVPGRERKTEPGLVAHLTDGRVAVFTTSLSTHEVLEGLAGVGVLTDLEQAMAGAPPVSRTPVAPAPFPAPPEAPPPGTAAPSTAPIPPPAFPDAWAKVTRAPADHRSSQPSSQPA